MSSNLPRYRQRRFRTLPLAGRIGLLALAGCLAVGALVMAITDGPPMLYARADGGSQVSDFTTDDATSDPDTGTTPSDVPVEPSETPSPSGSESPSPEDDSSGGSSDSDSDGDSSDSSEDSDSDSDYSVTSPPREPGSPRPSDPSEPTDDPSDPSEDPSDEPSEEPSDEPSSEPSEPVEPTVEPTSEPSEPTEPDYPGLPFLELSDSEEELLDSADDVRVEAGCPALRIDARLTAAARGHSEDMRDRRYYSHVSPDGATPQDRATDEGYTAEVAENLSYGLRTAQQVVRDWDGDELDKLLDCSYRSVGIGMERGLLRSWWTLMLGTA